MGQVVGTAVGLGLMITAWVFVGWLLLYRLPRRDGTYRGRR